MKRNGNIGADRHGRVRGGRWPKLEGVNRWLRTLILLARLANVVAGWFG